MTAFHLNRLPSYLPNLNQNLCCVPMEVDNTTAVVDVCALYWLYSYLVVVSLSDSNCLGRKPFSVKSYSMVSSTLSLTPEPSLWLLVASFRIIAEFIDLYFFIIHTVPVWLFSLLLHFKLEFLCLLIRHMVFHLKNTRLNHKQTYALRTEFRIILQLKLLSTIYMHHVISGSVYL